MKSRDLETLDSKILAGTLTLDSQNHSVADQNLALSNLDATKYVLQPGPLLGSSISIRKMIKSVVDLSEASSSTRIASLILSDASGCLFILGTITGASHVSALNACTILVKTHQFRMHRCNDCVVYLHCSSRPIIEDCQQIRFAPLIQSSVCEP